MGKVYGLWPLELRPGVNTEECEIDSLVVRDRVSPPAGLSEEGQEWYAAAQPILEQWCQYTTTAPGLDGSFTDFHDITGQDS